MQLLRLAAVAALIGLSACASRTERAPAPAESSYEFAPWSDQGYTYRLGAGDEIALRFVVNPDLNTQAVLGPDGRAVLPLVSGVELAGLTVDEADNVLTRAYSGVLRQPQVQALVVNYAAAQIYVGGEVRQAGALPIRGRQRVSQAIMAAGGFLETAKTGKIIVLRQRASDGRLMMRTLDVKATLAGKPDQDLFVLPGDLIFVPRSTIAEINLFVRQFITGALPFSFNYSINRGTNF